MRRLVWLAIAAVVAGCVVLDYGIVAEAYGPGPPYYGRTVNMDKWESPNAMLIGVHVVGLLLAALLVAILRRYKPVAR